MHSVHILVGSKWVGFRSPRNVCLHQYAVCSDTMGPLHGVAAANRSRCGHGCCACATSDVDGCGGCGCSPGASPDWLLQYQVRRTLHPSAHVRHRPHWRILCAYPQMYRSMLWRMVMDESPSHRFAFGDGNGSYINLLRSALTYSHTYVTS